MSPAQRTKKHSIILRLGLATCKPLPSRTYVRTTGASGKLPHGPLQALSPTTLLSFRTRVRASVLLGGGRGTVRHPHSCTAAGTAPPVPCTHSGPRRGRDKGKGCWETMGHGSSRGAGGLCTWPGLGHGGDVGRSTGPPGSPGRLTAGAVGHSGQWRLFPRLFSSAPPAPRYCGIYAGTQLSHALPSSLPVTSASLNPSSHPPAGIREPGPNRLLQRQTRPNSHWGCGRRRRDRTGKLSPIFYPEGLRPPGPFFQNDRRGAVGGWGVLRVASVFTDTEGSWPHTSRPFPG